jgi:hypothetical protein
MRRVQAQRLRRWFVVAEQRLSDQENVNRPEE